MNKLALVTAVALAAATINTQAEDGGGHFSLTPSIGYYLYDSERSLDDATALGAALGYEFNNPWALELVYLRANTDSDTANSIDVDHDQLRLDALYYFNRGETVQPYLAGGLGRGDFEADSFDVDETMANLGGGFRYFFQDNAALRTDVRAIYGDEDSTVDVVLSLGLNLLFGSSTGAAAAAPVAAAVAASESTTDVVDSDNDGVADALDQCPATQAGVQVDASGCELDNDSDGVANSIDQCAGTEPGAKVDDVGCYLELLESKEINLAVQFSTMSDVVPQASMPEIEAVAEFMNAYVNTDVVIEGHTDSSGAAGYNQALSERRANAVAAALTNRFGIDAKRVSAVGFGETQPLVSNDTAANRALNRRVVAVVAAQVKSIVK